MIDYQTRTVKTSTTKLTPLPDKLQGQSALWKSGAAPTGALYDAGALELTFRTSV